MDPGSGEERALRLSLRASLVLAVVAVVWGLLARSQVILLDGVYLVLGMATTGLALYAARVAGSGPSPRYPFGREAVVPLVTGVQGVALLGALAYASVEAVRVILAGGAPADPWVLGSYAVVSGGAAALLAHRMRRGPASELLAAEAVQWRAGALFSALVLGGALVVAVLDATGENAATRYVDSALVLVCSALLVRDPVRLVRASLDELLEAAPSSEVQAAVQVVIDRVTAAHGLGEPRVRLTKLGRKLYVEVDFVVADGTRDVADEDEVRRAVADGLDGHTPYEVWLNVALTTDPELAR